MHITVKTFYLCVRASVCECAMPATVHACVRACRQRVRSSRESVFDRECVRVECECVRVKCGCVRVELERVYECVRV